LKLALKLGCLPVLILLAGGAIWIDGDVTFAGGVRFLNNQASPEGQYGYGGAIYVDGNSTLSFGGPAVFRNNSASKGGAVALGDSYSRVTVVSMPRMVFSNSRSSSCWTGNRASVAVNAGAALHIQSSGKAEFGVAPHNFGSNKAGTVVGGKEQDVVVLAKGSYKCKTAAGKGAGSYKVEGSICAASCRLSSCKCPVSQSFDTNKCSCQRNV
jgi:predicted outer membrane repeat protein